MDREEYVERVLALVEQIPPGRVMSYGAIAEVVGVGGPRQVGRVMSTEGGPVPWWRVVRADGGLPRCHEGEARERHRAEGTPMRGPDRVDIAATHWWPDESESESESEYGSPSESEGGGGFVGRL